jgi:tyrosyl-tRNA synthetase
MKNLIDELKWRGLIHDMISGTEEKLIEDKVTGYIGFDPTSDSLHIGSLVPIILLMHLKRAGHTPIALVGGATGMIGDPSGKSNERNLLDKETLDMNVEGITGTLKRFLPDIEVVNNYDWMKDFSFIDFARDVGKRITVNYMLSKQSVKNRIEGEGMSFTEFTYQLLQGYDFLHLNQTRNCVLQMGGSDQWGNIITGADLIRKTTGGEAFAITCPLLTKSDGTKFGKSEGGENIWLDEEKTSVFKFYQFWLGVSDDDAERLIKIFTFMEREETEHLIRKHNEARHLYLLQKKLAWSLTEMVHGREEAINAEKTTEILFGGRDINSIPDGAIRNLIEELPSSEIRIGDLENGVSMVEFLEKTNLFSSRSDIRRAIIENSVSINSKKINEEKIVNHGDIIGDRIILVKRGKKKHFVFEVVS